MDFIPLDPTDDDVSSLLKSLCSFPLSFVEIKHPGDYQNEHIVFRAEEDIESLYGFILFYSVTDTGTDLPDYTTSRFLEFDEIELQKGSLLHIYTRKGKDSTSIEFETAAINGNIYWGLPEPIWHIPHASYTIMKRNDSIKGGQS